MRQASECQSGAGGGGLSESRLDSEAVVSCFKFTGRV